MNYSIREIAAAILSVEERRLEREQSDLQYMKDHGITEPAAILIREMDLAAQQARVDFLKGVLDRKG
ncbi:MAG: hypothetical protein LC731_07850 [Acidobacteria bacterium]|nr:hypothetical protein [Acidobacteriota bacterium]